MERRGSRILVIVALSLAALALGALGSANWWDERVSNSLLFAAWCLALLVLLLALIVRGALLVVGSLALLLVLASSVWLMINPAGDQPLAALFETAAEMGPAGFLDARDRETYDSAARDMVRFQAEVDRLNAMERTARYEGASLSDEDIRRIASYQQSFNEMTRGERFVQDVLRTKARTRERWIVGLPLAVLASLGLGMLARQSM